MRVSKALFIIGFAGSLAAAGTIPSASAGGVASASPSGVHAHVDCSQSRVLCTEVDNYDSVFGDKHYVGHDEPSALFYSHKPGSGANMRYQIRLPKDPPPTPIIGKRSYNFQLYAATWFGMAMCDTQSYPETVKTCTPASDRNIAAPGDPKHPGTAFEELQLYPPGYVQQFNGFSCSATQWCAALNIDSLSENPVTGQLLNSSCAARVGIEYVNFAYLTRSGTPQGPPNPVNFDPVKSGQPNPRKVAFFNPGDTLTVTLHDTPHGLRTVIHDGTSGDTGIMTASAANGFGQVKFAPTGTTCKNIPYDFHPMYSTSTPQTRVPWAAATYNVAFDTEIGHFDYCSKVPAPFGNCAGEEGGYTIRNHRTDKDDTYCFPRTFSTLVKTGGCLGSNIGFDGTSYVRDWPNGDTNLRPTPTIFTSPKTGSGYDTQYSQVAFNTDLPRIEDPTFSPANHCDRTTGHGCVKPPVSDDHVPAAFYPYYTSGNALGGCAWTVGQAVPGFTSRTYGGIAQYGPILKVKYIGLGGTPVFRYNDFQHILPNNPCPSP